MKYTLDNLHLNHVWSSAFQKWFCSTTSDLSFKEVSFHQMPAFRSQVNQTQTNFPGGCNDSDKHLTGSASDLCVTAGVSACCCKFPSCCVFIHHHQFPARCHEVSLKYHHCPLLAWTALAETLHLVWCYFTNIVPVSWPKFALPKGPGHSRLHRITVPCFILEIAISWF